MRIPTVLLSFLLFAPCAAANAQQAPDAEHHGMRHPMMQTRETDALRQGLGMGMAHVAESNGYPGPMHVLEHAEALELTETQLSRTQEIRQRVRSRAPALGARIADAEQRLERMFAENDITPKAMDSLLMEIAGLRAQLRSLHLTAHIDQAAILTESQIAKYRELRDAASAGGERRPMRRYSGPLRPSDKKEG